MICILASSLLLSCGGSHMEYASEALEAKIDSLNTGLLSEDDIPGSPRRMTMTTIDGNEIAIDYSSPGTRGRIIWGGLVSYNQVWVTGAHTASSISFSKDIVINNVDIAAGKYALFTIPGRESWKVILNENYDQHLADDYDEALDVFRVTVKPDSLAIPYQRLTFEVSEGPTPTISIKWDQLAVNVLFQNR